MTNDKEPDFLGAAVVFCGVLEAFTFALWINSANKFTTSLFWALPLLVGQCLTGLFCLQMWYDKRYQTPRGEK